MKKLFLILLGIMFYFSLLKYSVNGYPYQCSINDLANDTLNIYTGAPVLECPGYIDIISVNVIEDANYLTIKISVKDTISESSESNIYYYFLLDRDNDPKNNCNDPPFNFCDTFYTIRIKNTVTVSKSIWNPWGWSDESTNAKSIFESSNTISIKIPKNEIGLNSNPKELPWRVITEIEYMCGDFAPNSGTAILKRYFYEKNIVITIPVEVPAIYIDGIEYKPSNGKVEISLAPGEYEFFVPQEIPISKHVKLIFIEWSDGVKDNRRRVKITEEGFNVTCIYEKYFYVKVYSPIGNTTPPEGWYPEDEKLTIGVVENQINVTKNTRYMFSFWNGSWGSNNFDFKKHLQTITLKDSIEINATWIKYHFISVISRYDEPRGGGWYIENSTAEISVKSILIFDNGTKVVFKKWGGDISVTKNNFTLTVDKPYTIIAEWDRFFQTSFRFWTPDREQVLPEFISIAGGEGKLQLTSYTNIWLKEGVYRLIDVAYKGGNVKPKEETIFNIDGSKTFDIECRIYDISVKVFDIFGFMVPGISVSTVLPNGEVVKGSGTGLVGLENLPCGTYTVRISILFFYTKTMSIELYSDREIVLTIPISALLIALFLGIIGGGYYYSRRRCVKENIAFKFLGNELLKELSNIPAISRKLEELDKKYGEIFLKYLDTKARKKVLEEQLSRAKKHRDESISFYENAARRARETGRHMSAYYAEKALQYTIKRYNKIISKLSFELENIGRELSEVMGEMNNINAQRKIVIDELLMRIDRARDLLKKIYDINPVCIKCGDIQKLYNDVDEILMQIMEEISRLDGKVKSGEDELRRLKNRLKEIRDEINRVEGEIEKSREIVERVFSDMIGGEASDYIEICGVRINLTGRIEEFFDRYDAFRRELGKTIRSYWRNKKLLGKLTTEKISAQNKIEAFQEYLNNLKSDLNRLRASATNVKNILDDINESYRICKLKLNRCREKVKRRLKEEKGRLKEYIRELNRLRNEEIYRFRESIDGLKKRIEGYRRSFINLRSRIEDFKSDPGYPDEFLNLEGVKKLLNRLDEFLGEIDEFIDKSGKAGLIPECEDEVKEISDMVENINNRIGETLGNIKGLLNKIDGEYIPMLEKVESFEQCMNVWKKYLGERDKNVGKIDKIKSNIRRTSGRIEDLEDKVEFIEDTLSRLKKMFEGIQKNIKKVIAEARLKEVLKDEDIKKLARDREIMKILKEMLDVAADSSSKVKIIKASVESDIDVDKEVAEYLIKGIKDVISQITNLPIPDTPEEIANEIKDTIGLFEKPERETDYLRKLSTILSKLPSNPLTPFINMYSKILKIFASAIDRLADMIWELGVEEMKLLAGDYEKWLTEDILLKKDMDEIYRKVEEKVKENIMRMRATESFEKRVDRLVRSIIIKRLAKIIGDP